METDSLKERLEPLAERLALDQGLSLVDLAVHRKAHEARIVITIDKRGGVTVEDCQALSHVLDEALVDLNLMEGSYSLEVESPGLDRKLKSEREFAYFRGRTVEITTYAPVNGDRRFVATLVGLDDDSIVISDEAGEKRIPRQQVAKARLHVPF